MNFIVHRDMEVFKLCYENRDRTKDDKNLQGWQINQPIHWIPRLI